jgi:Ala-tRNA(Pro) deacylase
MPSLQHEQARLFARFHELGIETTTHAHEKLFTVEQSRAARGDIPGSHCKNLFLKDRKQGLWLLVALEGAKIDLKRLPAVIGSHRLSFGNAELLMSVLGVEPGSVTPYALINDTGPQVNVVLDKTMMTHDLLNYHPLSNDATTTIAARDLVRFIESCGHRPEIREIAGNG